MQNSIAVTRVLPVSAGKVWSFINDNLWVSVYLPFIKSSFNESIQLNTIRVSVVYWEGLFGTLRERCLVCKHKESLMWRIEEDSRRVFQPDFIWGFEIDHTGANQCTLRIIATYTTKNRMKNMIEGFKLKFMFRESLNAIQTALG